MRNHALALMLLLLFGGSLLAGAHPCQTQPAPDTATAPVEQGRSACHGAGAETDPPSDPRGDGNGCSGQHGCMHACHMVALVQVPVSVFAVQPQTAMVAPTVTRSLPLFSAPIDHIPLG